VIEVGLLAPVEYCTEVRLPRDPEITVSWGRPVLVVREFPSYPYDTVLTGTQLLPEGTRVVTVDGRLTIPLPKDA
jgi:hypothetical protein